MGDSLVSWKTKKQATISSSSAEAEYRSMGSTVCELLWISYILQEFGISVSSPIPFHCDNKTAIHITENPVFHERTKHLNIDCHLIRDHFKRGFILPRHIPSAQQYSFINGLLAIFTGLYFRNGVDIGLGVVARDQTGTVIAWMSLKFPRKADAEHTEAFAARATAELANSYGWPRVILEGDCLNLIRKLNTPAPDLSNIGPVVSDIKSYLAHYCVLNSLTLLEIVIGYLTTKFARGRHCGHSVFTLPEAILFNLCDDDFT
ncbi:UNVERIFIED_CONTAM: hypothetical protein Slati_1013200 [Sesamum latifolium]|uniref:RNase H type-1 domain-containing protein n=1 Tax=Sesamum latifolium TaxID=2727402 RepID=A0AAW2XT72_9LAMI